MKKLGFGLMRLPKTEPDDNSSIDIVEFCRMADEFIDGGFTYFDTAYMYHDGKSEEALSKAVVLRHPRDSFTIADKLPVWFLKEAGDMEKVFSEQLKRCGTDYFDYYLLHSLNKRHVELAEKLGAFKFISDKKAAGLVRHIGFSFHDTAETLDEILTAHPEMEFVQLQINYLDWESENVQSRKCYETARRHGKSVIIMEPVKGGDLAGAPPKAEKLLREREPDMSVASWAVRFAAGLDGVITVLSGMSNMTQLRDNMSYMSNFTPLSEDDVSVLMSTLSIRAKAAVPCTSCEYCVEGCPEGIAIPKFLALYNSASKKGFANLGRERKDCLELCKNGAPASACISCKSCEEVCPQRIGITEFLHKTAELLES